MVSTPGVTASNRRHCAADVCAVAPEHAATPRCGAHAWLMTTTMQKTTPSHVGSPHTTQKCQALDRSPLRGMVVRTLACVHLPHRHAHLRVLAARANHKYQPHSHQSRIATGATGRHIQCHSRCTHNMGPMPFEYQLLPLTRTSPIPSNQIRSTRLLLVWA